MLRDLLINDYNIEKMSVKNSTEFNVKRLLNNNNLNHSQSIIFGLIFEDFIKNIIKNSGYELIYEKYFKIIKNLVYL